MLKPLCLFVALSSVLVVSAVVADDATPSDKDLETLMCERGKLLLSDDFDKGPSQAWRIAKGKWEVADGVTQAAELKADNHGAVIRSNLPFRNAVIQYSFQLQGARTTTLSINDAKGHNSRVIINTKGFFVRKDDHDKKGPDKAVVLQRVNKAIPEGQWHTLVVEINGPDFLARLDGKKIAYGSHAAIDVEKTNIGLTVAGQSVLFKDFRIWECSPKADWATTKAKLLAQTKK